MTNRYALGVEYLGTAYHGWQRQVDLKSVQAELETALSRVADVDVTVVCAGRTDTGVHALGQVVHFDCAAKRSERAWLLGTNQYLPRDISVSWCQQVDADFHARFSATARTYRYTIYNYPVRSAIQMNRALWYCHPLDIDLMKQGSDYLVGQHDFSSFRASQCQAHSPVRNIESIEIIRQGDDIMLEFKANAFLHNMIRNIVGVLLKVGDGQASPTWVQEVLAAKSRDCAAKTASPMGLYFYQVDYPSHFAIPKRESSKFFLI